jgi:hypothetical protein
VGDYEAPLDELRWHWGEAYLIHYLSGPDRWVAQRRDSHATMSAENADGLLVLIRADYNARPVSRRIAGTGRPETPGCRFMPDG